MFFDYNIKCHKHSLHTFIKQYCSSFKDNVKLITITKCFLSIIFTFVISCIINF